MFLCRIPLADISYLMIKLPSFLSLLFSLVSLLMALSCVGQQKYEREYRIKPGEIPPRAARFIDDVFRRVPIRWYGEESLTGKTIEAKLRSGGKRYSIEFDPTGEIQDVEIQTHFRQLPVKAKMRISEELTRKFDKFTVSKSQWQWTASQADLKIALLTDSLPTSVQIRYELIIKARKDRSENQYEVLSEQNGAVIRIHQLVERNSTNLIY